MSPRYLQEDKALYKWVQEKNSLRVWPCKILLQDINLSQFFYTLSRTRPVGWEKVNCEGKTGGRTTEKDLVKKTTGKKEQGWEGLREWGEGIKLVRKRKRQKIWEEVKRQIFSGLWSCNCWARCTLKHTLKDVPVVHLVGLGEEYLIHSSYLLIWIEKRILLRLSSLL